MIAVGGCWVGACWVGACWVGVRPLGGCRLGGCRLGACRLGACRLGACRLWFVPAWRVGVVQGWLGAISYGVPSGRVTWTFPVVWLRVMCQRPSWTVAWWKRHRHRRLSTFVGPPWYQARIWWVSVQEVGVSQPGQRQPRSRACRALRIQWGTMRLLRPMFRGSPVVGSSTHRHMSLSQATRCATWVGMAPIQVSQACSGVGGIPISESGSTIPEPGVPASLFPASQAPGPQAGPQPSESESKSGSKSGVGSKSGSEP